MRDVQRTNIDIDVKELLAMLANNNSDPNKVSEKIEEDIERVLKKVSIVDIADFISDHSLVFNTFLDEEDI